MFTWSKQQSVCIAQLLLFSAQEEPADVPVLHVIENLTRAVFPLNRLLLLVFIVGLQMAAASLHLGTGCPLSKYCTRQLTYVCLYVCTHYKQRNVPQVIATISRPSKSLEI